MFYHFATTTPFGFVTVSLRHCIIHELKGGLLCLREVDQIFITSNGHFLPSYIHFIFIKEYTAAALVVECELALC